MSRHLFPREHGAYAELGFPLLSGLVLASPGAASWLSAPFTVRRRDVPAVGPAAPPAAFALRLLDAHPGAGPVTLEWAVPAPGPGRVDVLDVRGARVRTLASGPRAAGTFVLRWDGRDASGNFARPGVYFVRAEGGRASATRRVVVLR